MRKSRRRGRSGSGRRRCRRGREAGLGAAVTDRRPGGRPAPAEERGAQSDGGEGRRGAAGGARVPPPAPSGIVGGVSSLRARLGISAALVVAVVVEPQHLPAEPHRLARGRGRGPRRGRGRRPRRRRRPRRAHDGADRRGRSWSSSPTTARRCPRFTRSPSPPAPAGPPRSSRAPRPRRRRGSLDLADAGGRRGGSSSPSPTARSACTSSPSRSSGSANPPRRRGRRGADGRAAARAAAEPAGRARVRARSAILLLAVGLDVVARRLRAPPARRGARARCRAPRPGDLRRPRADGVGADEIGAVAERLNAMLDRMGGFNETLRAEVERATGRAARREPRAARRRRSGSSPRAASSRESQRLALAGADGRLGRSPGRARRST